MGTPHRTLFVAFAAALTAVFLSGCGILEPTRDVDGNIARPTVMPSPDVRIDDCFTFVDGTDLAYATVVPCSEPHAYIVIGQGKLSQTKVDLAGSLQVAVSDACERVFDAFTVDSPVGGKPGQEFIVSQIEKPGGLVTYYSCLATDSA
jgi:hypothetical protein